MNNNTTIAIIISILSFVPAGVMAARMSEPPASMKQETVRVRSSAAKDVEAAAYKLPVVEIVARRPKTVVRDVCNHEQMETENWRSVKVCRTGDWTSNERPRFDSGFRNSLP